MRKKITNLFMLVLSGIILFSALTPFCCAHAVPEDGTSQDKKAKVEEFEGNLEGSIRSMQKDYFMGSIHKTIQDGSNVITDIDGKKEKERKELNYSIMNGDAKEEYSLYDRFGTGIKFPLYLGEKLVVTGALDKVYTVLINGEEKKLSFSNIVELIAKNPTAYINRYYNNRPPLKNNGNDPRVQQYDNVGGITMGNDASLGFANWYLNFSQGITSVVTTLASGELTKAAFGSAKDFFTDENWKPIREFLFALFPLFLIGAIVFAVAQGGKTFLGSFSFKNFLTKIIGVLLSIGIFFGLATQPTLLLKATETVSMFGEKIVSVALNETHKDDEIVHSSKTDNVIAASIWEESIFKPWVKGVFSGKNYNELYTTFAGKPENETWKLHSDSANAIGDISVPIGNGKSIKNWAALAYSTQSIYHIDSVKNGAAKPLNNKNELDKYIWPKASMTNNKSIYRDDFRWLDAYMKVGHYAKHDGSQGVSDYIETTPYDFRGDTHCLEMLYLSLLLIPIGVLAFRKYKSIVYVIFSSVMIIFRAAGNIFKPEDNKLSIAGSAKSLWSNIKLYIWYCLLVGIGITLYKAIGVSEDFMKTLVYLGMMIYLCRLKPETLKGEFEGARDLVKSKAFDYVYSVKEASSRNWESRKEKAPMDKTIQNDINTQSMKEQELKANGKETEDSSIDEDLFDTDYTEDEKKRYGEYINGVPKKFYSIKKEDYEGYEHKTKNERYKRRYAALWSALNCCTTNREIAMAINKHREFYYGYDERGVRVYGNEMDFRVLGIEKNQKASYIYYNDRHVEGYDLAKAGISRARQNLIAQRKEKQTKRLESINGLIRQVGSVNQDKGPMHKRMNARLTRKAKHEINSYFRDKKFNQAQEVINAFTGNAMGGTIIGLKLKLYIFLGVVGVLLFWQVLAMLFGA